MRSSKNKKSAFTLLELIVAMAIIAVLMGLSLYGIQTVQRNQRDTERRAALSNINLEVTSFYGDWGHYPATVTVGQSSGGKSTVTISDPSLSSPRTLVIQGSATKNATQCNPTNVSCQTNTVYCYTTNGTSYELGVNLEGSGWGATGTASMLGNQGTSCSATLI